MRTNTFFTIFIAVYLLCGVMLYDVLSLTYTDEIMVLLLVLYTGFRWAGSKKKLDKETKWFGAIALFYLFYSFIDTYTTIYMNYIVSRL